MNAQTVLRIGAWVALALLSVVPAVVGQSVNQTITLQPGWNSVYLEVQPTNNATEAVFAGLPIASAWTRAERLSSAEFIQNASEVTLNKAVWLGWFNPSRPEAFLNSLFAVQANRAYLIKSTNATPVVWTLTGRPPLRQPEWVPDAYNLRGLPVDPASPPTFLNFFRYSAAHLNPTNGQLESIYRLNPSGQWARVSSNDFMKSGEAYWIHTRGASDYNGPLNVSLNLGDGLDYGLDLKELSVKLENLTSGQKNVTVQELGLNGHRLSYFVFDPVQGGQWLALTNPITLSVGGNSNLTLRLAVRRQDLSGSNYESLFKISDEAGAEFQVPVSATKSLPLSGGSALAGLWVGTVRLDAISEPRSANPGTPTPVPAPLNLRLIIHVADSGQARLLKEVTQMWRDGTYTNDASGNQIADQPGEYVLLTDDSLIPQFSGSALKDGTPIGRRVSTVGFDFPSTSATNFLILSGLFTISNTLTGSITLPYDYPLNPFLHKYNPDHDNLNARFDGPAVEAFTVTRQFGFDFTASPPDGPAAPDFGYNEMGGNYHETVTGIHKDAIYLSGSFRLSRVSLISQLNPSPNP